MSAPLRKFEQLTLGESMQTRGGDSSRGPPKTHSSPTSAASSAEDVAGHEDPVVTEPISQPSALLAALEAVEPGLVDGLLNPAVRRDVAARRAIEVRDVLSTFDRLQFPAEYIKKSIFDRTQYLEVPRPIEDCVEKEDLQSTWFLLGVNHPAMYYILRNLVQEDRCAQYLSEKLKRRIDAELNELDKLRHDDTIVPERIHAGVVQIAANLRDIVEKTRVDYIDRQQGGIEIAKHLVYLLRIVCESNYNVSRERPGGPRRSSRGSGGSANLFQILIGSAPDYVPHFQLDALKVLPSEAVSVHSEVLSRVRTLLVQNGVSETSAYVKEFDSTIELTVPEVDTRQARKRPAGGNGRGDQKRPNRA